MIDTDTAVLSYIGIAIIDVGSLTIYPHVIDNSSMAARQRRSRVWEHFTISGSDESKVSYCICEAVVLRGGKDAKSYITSLTYVTISRLEEYPQL